MREFWKWLYDIYPEVYRVEDRLKGNYTLKRYLQAIDEGGVEPVFEETEKLLELIDIDKCPVEYLPYISKMLGFEYDNDIPEVFMRRLIKNLVSIYRMKGTKSAIRYIARELTGFEVEIVELQSRVFRTWSSNDHKEMGDYKTPTTFKNGDTDMCGLKGDKYRNKNFILKLKAPENMSMLETKEELVENFLNRFIPYRSKMYLITAYYFEDEIDISSKVEEGKEQELIKVKDEEIIDIPSQEVEDYGIIKIGIIEEEKILDNVESESSNTIGINEGEEIHRNYLEDKAKDEIKEFMGMITNFSKRPLNRLGTKLSQPPRYTTINY